MKSKYILAILLLVGCNSKVEAPEMTKTDSLLVISDSIAAKADLSSKILDSVTTITTQKVTDNVNILTNTITNYETQIRSAIKVKTVDRIIHDTVYIETKKSFWGKTKKTVTAKSDSTINQTEIIDTLKNDY